MLEIEVVRSLIIREFIYTRYEVNICHVLVIYGNGINDISCRLSMSGSGFWSCFPDAVAVLEELQ